MKRCSTTNIYNPRFYVRDETWRMQSISYKLSIVSTSEMKTLYSDVIRSWKTPLVRPQGTAVENVIVKIRWRIKGEKGLGRFKRTVLRVCNCHEGKDQERKSCRCFGVLSIQTVIFVAQDTKMLWVKQLLLIPAPIRKRYCKNISIVWIFCIHRYNRSAYQQCVNRGTFILEYVSLRQR